MHTYTTIHPTFAAEVGGYVSPVNDVPVAFLVITEGAQSVTIITRDPAFLDKLSNEAERLCREFVGDVPEPLRATGFYKCGVCKGEPAEVAR